MTDESSFTLPIMLLSARQGLWYSVEWGSLQAGVVITMIPCLVFYVVLQRYYVGGLQAGAVKACYRTDGHGVHIETPGREEDRGP